MHFLWRVFKNSLEFLQQMFDFVSQLFCIVLKDKIFSKTERKKLHIFW